MSAGLAKRSIERTFAAAQPGRSVTLAHALAVRGVQTRFDSVTRVFGFER